MNKTALTILASAVFTAAALAQFQPPRNNATAKLGDKAPKFEGLRWVQGQEFALEPGLVAVVVFWELDLQTSRDVFLRLTRFWNNNKDKNVKFVGITYEAERLVETILKRPVAPPFPIALDGRQRTFDAYMKPFDIRSIPHAFIIDADGKFFWQGHPMMQDFELALDQAISHRGQNYQLKNLGGGKTVWERRTPLPNQPQTRQPNQPQVPEQAQAPQAQSQTHGQPAPIRARPATNAVWQHPVFPWDAKISENAKTREFFASAAQTTDSIGRITALGIGDEFKDYTLVIYNDVPVSIERIYGDLGASADQNLSILQNALATSGFGWVVTPVPHPQNPPTRYYPTRLAEEANGIVITLTGNWEAPERRFTHASIKYEHAARRDALLKIEEEANKKEAEERAKHEGELKKQEEESRPKPPQIVL